MFGYIVPKDANLMPLHIKSIVNLHWELCLKLMCQRQREEDADAGSRGDPQAAKSSEPNFRAKRKELDKQLRLTENYPEDKKSFTRYH